MGVDSIKWELKSSSSYSIPLPICPGTSSDDCSWPHGLHSNAFGGDASSGPAASVADGSPIPWTALSLRASSSPILFLEVSSASSTSPIGFQLLWWG